RSSVFTRQTYGTCLPYSSSSSQGGHRRSFPTPPLFLHLKPTTLWAQEVGPETTSRAAERAERDHVQHKLSHLPCSNIAGSIWPSSCASQTCYHTIPNSLC